MFWPRGLTAVQNATEDELSDGAADGPSHFEISEMWVDRLVALQKTWITKNEASRVERGCRHYEDTVGSVKLQVLKPACFMDPWQRIMTDDEWCGVERVKQVQMEAGSEAMTISDVLAGL